MKSAFISDDSKRPNFFTPKVTTHMKHHNSQQMPQPSKMTAQNPFD